MKKTIHNVFMILMLLMPFGFLLWGNEIGVQIRLYEGFPESRDILSKVVSSFSLDVIPLDQDFPQQKISEEQQSLKRVFNLKEVKLITLGNIMIRKISDKEKSQLFIINQKNVVIQLTMISLKDNQFRIEILEDLENTTLINIPPSKKFQNQLLETTMVIPPDKTALIGFKDSESRTYFVSLSRFQEEPDNKAANLPLSRRSFSFVKPTLVHKVNPIYPEKAKEEGLQGLEIIHAWIDKSGYIANAEIHKSSYPLLAQSVMEAIKNWKYTPGYLDKKPIPVPLTVAVNFMLSENTHYSNQGNVRFSINSAKLRLLHKVPPIYPDEAVEKKLQGQVMVMAYLDRNGYLPQMKVLKGNPILARAAIAAMKQWRFEPYIENKKRQPLLFAITFSFTLKKTTSQ